MNNKEEWLGWAKELLEALGHFVGEPWARKKEWPKTPKALSGKLRRLAPALRRSKLHMTKLERTKHGRPIRLWWSRDDTDAHPHREWGKKPSPSSQPSPNGGKQPFPGDD